MAEQQFYHFRMDIDTYLKVVDLAVAHGKKPGDSMQEEFEEIARLNQEKITCLGVSGQDVDMLTGNLREEGINVLNLNEIQPKKESNEKEV